MHYQKELDFLLRFLKNYNINTYFYQKGNDISFLDFHIREILGNTQEYSRIEESMELYRHPNTIYKIIDDFSCIYFLLSLPNENMSLIIGPYIQNQFDKDYILHQIEQYQITPQIFQKLQEAFAEIPILWDDTSIQTLLQTFCEIVYPNKGSFQVQVLEYNMETSTHTHYPANVSNDILPHFDAQIYNAYLTQENNLIQAVSQGNVQSAEAVLSTIISFSIFDTAHNTLRNMKNYVISLNSLLNKSLQLNILNSYELISVSSRFLQKIELCSSPEKCLTLLHEMVRKYCLLVKNHTMKEYSPLIQQAIKEIDLDLGADLSLHTMAKKLNSNASYLSTQFKKVTGTTYTEYVQKKRIDHALLLLNTTSLQIQTIAQYCGVPDLNYFSKLFKKYVHYSPSAYRKEISNKDF